MAKLKSTILFVIRIVYTGGKVGALGRYTLELHVYAIIHVAYFGGSASIASWNPHKKVRSTNIAQSHRYYWTLAVTAFPVLWLKFSSLFLKEELFFRDIITVS